MEELKTFQIRISKDMWKFLKKESVDQEKSINKIIITSIEKSYKKSKKEVEDK